MGLISHTVVPSLPGSGETHATFGPDDEVPEWAAAYMGSHLFEDGEHPYPDSDYPDKGTPAPTREEGAEPPRHGKGSSRDAWVAFVNEKGLEVAEDASRDQIIADLVADGVIEE